MTTITIPLEVPEAIVTMGGVELYAKIYAGWTPTVFVDGEEVENPVSAQDAGIAYNQKRILEEFRSILLQLGREQGEKQALEQFNLLFPNSL